MREDASKATCLWLFQSAPDREAGRCATGEQPAANERNVSIRARP